MSYLVEGICMSIMALFVGVLCVLNAATSHWLPFTICLVAFFLDTSAAIINFMVWHKWRKWNDKI